MNGKTWGMGVAVGILGTGSYLPTRVVTNVDLLALVPDADPEWVSRKTMIEARRFAAPGEAASDLAANAARAALDRAGVAAAEIDYIVLSTSTGDSPQPPTSNLVQNAIGATRAACMDVNAVCAGFVFALGVANGLIATNPDALVLVIASDIYSRILDFGDRRTAVLFGDGAGAAVVGRVTDGHGILDLDLASRGDANDLIYVKGGGSRLPASPQTVADGDHYFRMNGRGVRDFVATAVPPALDALLRRNELKAEDVDHFVPHQANGMMLQELVESAGFQNAHTHLTLPWYGNVGSASLPVTLDDAARNGSLRDGEVVLLAGFGGGMSMGACLLRWGR
ncbi:3-oxoacyl-[acyl-carrier-protein] synthase 3 [Actinoplanes lobatus]|uniref:3-oxoacyl-[acyl-carrier-protein] synthase 3 n=1 Tax=Actinoplanes lobatus TaxID=113568 RepID=A0A7W7HE85_9ACTN|nr:ketoacyl-ACP synthase III [Actinoplanes lobatus]MBB4748865.1 3-oxoacyl-[acyl-carrier-protein] synthase-3 [Actinoplanes lobatus]GGN67755.1 3-oxoacyl-[acyl-carrier-protein] synthase 3 [Actinoplanes lobatus]GIE37227.1 3-oxoacyl-[acyl-carrier-protein] synthase 3 [Actinoplanes lobatus]